MTPRVPDLVLALSVSLATLAGLAPAEAHQPEVSLSPINGDRLQGYVETLANFGTRHTLSETESDTRGIGAARRWIRETFEDAVADSGRTGDLTPRVYFDSHLVEPDGRRITQAVDVVNVVCEIPGAQPESRDRLYYVVAHYDSRASEANDAVSDAPGANDDASGVAVLLGLARALSTERLDSTVVLMAVAGEEQGLFGSRRHALAAREAGLDIRAVLSNDTVGDPSGPGGRMARHEIRVFSEGLPIDLFDAERGGLTELRRIRGFSSEVDSPSRQLARYMDEVARDADLPVKPRLIYRPDRFLRGGDHTGFNEAGYPAIRLIEVYEDYTKQHQDVRTEDGVDYGDTAEFTDPGYLADVTLLNAATLVHLANAPSEPGNVRLLAAELTNDTTLRWDASPEPDAAGYEIVWRETTSPVWQHSLDVGDATEGTVDLSKDNWYFGVRAYDRDGYRSPVVWPGVGRE